MAEEYVNAEGVTEMTKSVFRALSGLGGPARQYWFDWFPDIAPDEWNEGYTRIYLRPYIGEIDPQVAFPTQWQYDKAREACNRADLVQGLGLISFLNFENPGEHYYIKVAAPLVGAMDGMEMPFSYDPINGRFFMMSLPLPEETDILEQALIILFLLPKIIVTVFEKEIIGTDLPLYPAILPDWLNEEEE